MNLIEPESLSILKGAYEALVIICKEINQDLPENKNDNRQLDCAVIMYAHQSRIIEGKPPYDTVRCAFPEGEAIYPGTTLSSRGHIQVCVLNEDMIKAYFLPRPLADFNPYLKNPK